MREAEMYMSRDKEGRPKTVEVILDSVIQEQKYNVGGEIPHK